MINESKIKEMLELLRDQGFVNADDDDELEYLTELVSGLLNK